MILNCTVQCCVYWRRHGCNHPEGPQLIGNPAGRGLLCTDSKEPAVPAVI